MMIRRAIAVLAFGLTACVPLAAQTCTTASCTAASVSETDVLAALPSPSNTHATVVVTIPSGTAAWTTVSTYTVPAAVTNLTIQGATTVSCSGTPGTSGYSCTATDNTVIKDNLAGSATLLTITTGASSTFFRITGITLEPFNSSTSAKSQGIWTFGGSTSNFRWDHSHIVVNDSDNEGPEIDGQIEGVIDHNLMNGGTVSSFTNIIRVYNDLLDSVGNGDGGWMAATQWGSQHAMFLEDNYVTGGYTTDCAIAGRVVSRYSTFFNSQGPSGAVHSTKDDAGPERGCRSEEFYHNYISGSGTVDFAATGGEGSSLIVWDNTLGTLTDDFFFAGGLNRNSTGSSPPPSGRNPPNGWALCGTTVASSFGVSGTGTSTWDANSNTATGYPCLDGFGRGQQQDTMNGANFPSRANTTRGGQTWPHQLLEPIYFWENTLPGGMSGFANLSDESTDLNRDVYTDCDSYNSSCSSGFTGTAGTGFGTLASRPTTCTAGPGGTFGVSPTGSYGVAYWATDANSGNGELYVCTATNTWTGIYQPYTYPHPLDGGGTTFSLTVTATNGSVSGTDCSTGSYASGTSIGACTATPNTGYTFTGWSSTGSASCSGTGTCGPFSITANSTITAAFTINTYTLGVTATNGSVSGTNCSAGTYNYNTAIGACTATPNSGYTFSGWSGTGSCSGVSGTGTASCTLTSNSTLTATFTASGVPVATGDSRTVTEPVDPPICSTVAATKYIVLTNALNLDPFNATCGSTGGTNGAIGCTGGTDDEPSSTATPTYTASETLDNTAIQAALDACPAGQAVELVPGAGGQRGFVAAPLHAPNGVGLNIPAGIHVYLSRNLSDYGGTNCGEVTTGSSSCNHWFTSPGTTGSGIYGLGEIDGRGWDAYIGDSTHSFYINRLIAYCNARGGATQHGSPTCPTLGTGTNSFGPNMIDLEGANNFTVHDTTFKDAGNFFLNFVSGSGLTVWGANVIGPFEVLNTDGIDPVNSTNVTVTHGIISVGDNQVAIKATSGPSSNITVSNTQTGAGIALAIGSATLHGVSNVLVTNVVQKGNLNSDLSAGLQIASSGANGGTVDTESVIGDCMVAETNSIRVYTNYDGDSGPNTPIYQNILYRDITVLADTNGNSGHFTFQGLSGFPIGAQVDGVTIDGTNQGPASQNGVTTDQFAAVHLGTGPVPTSMITQFSAGTGVTTTGSGGAGTPYPCDSSTWKPLTGGMTVDMTTGPGPFKFHVVIHPATEINEKESSALTANLQLLEDGVPVASTALDAAGSFASFSVASVTPGTHTFQASYPGDSNYPAFTFGNVVTENISPTVTAAPQMLMGAITTQEIR